MSETCRGHLWDKITIKLFASSWYIFLTYIYDARSHLYQMRKRSCNSDSRITEHIPKVTMIIRKVLKYNTSISRAWLRSVSIVQDTLAELILLKFIRSNANSKTQVGQYLETLQQSFLKKNIRQMTPSRLMHWWIRFITLSITRTWQLTVDMAFISSEILSFWLWKSPECAWNILLLK